MRLNRLLGKIKAEIPLFGIRRVGFLVLGVSLVIDGDDPAVGAIVERLPGSSLFDEPLKPRMSDRGDLADAFGVIRNGE